MTNGVSIETGIIKDDVTNALVILGNGIANEHDAFGRLKCRIGTINYFFEITVFKTSDRKSYFIEIGCQILRSKTVIGIQVLNDGIVIGTNF